MKKNQDSGQVEAHSEKFNINILDVKNLKNAVSAQDISKITPTIMMGSDSLQEDTKNNSYKDESFGVDDYDEISAEEALSLYEENLEDGDSEDLINKKNASKASLKSLKKSSKVKSSILAPIKVYIPVEYHYFIEKFKIRKRINAGLGSGVVEIIKQFEKMNKRNEIQINRIAQLLTSLEVEIENLSALKMKGAAFEEIKIQDERLYSVSKEVIGLMDFLGFSRTDLLEELPEFCKRSLNYAFNLIDRKLIEHKSRMSPQRSYANN